MSLEQQLQNQHFANGYELVNGVAMRAANGDRFQIPPQVLKKYITCGYFVELRVDSPRFSVHPDAPEKCTCELCDSETSKPVLGHDHPASLVPVPRQNIPSRGWGEDFWVRVDDRDGNCFRGTVDNPLYEQRLHEIQQDDAIVFHADHVLAIHPSHRKHMVMEMNETDLQELVRWLGTVE